MTIEGGCRCGAVRYTIAADTLPRTYACHCLDCQTWSGSAFAQATFLAEEQLTIAGPTVIYEIATPSGRISKQRMCGVCHTRIFNSNSARPGAIALRAGTLDRSNELELVAHIWTKSKQPWFVIPEDVPSWPENAAPADLVSMLALLRG